MGFGLSVLGESNILKYSDAPFLDWFLPGTGGLILIFAGLSLFGQGVVYKVFIDKDRNDFN